MIRRFFAYQALLFVLVIGIAASALALEGVREKRVHFKRGANSVVIDGHIKGRETIDYVVNAREGQLLTAKLSTNNGANYFNILAPGEEYVAFFNGSISNPLNEYKGSVPKSGDLKFRVYLMRSAARRGEVAKFKLAIAVTKPEH